MRLTPSAPRMFFPLVPAQDLLYGLIAVQTPTSFSLPYLYSEFITRPVSAFIQMSLAHPPRLVVTTSVV